MKFKILASSPKELDWSEKLHIKMLGMVIENQSKMIDMLNSLINGQPDPDNEE